MRAEIEITGELLRIEGRIGHDALAAYERSFLLAKADALRWVLGLPEIDLDEL